MGTHAAIVYVIEVSIVVVGALGVLAGLSAAAAWLANAILRTSRFWADAIRFMQALNHIPRSRRLLLRGPEYRIVLRVEPAKDPR